MLEICEVHDMAPSNMTRENGLMNITLEQFPGIPHLGQLPTWYEASFQSTIVQEAFKQNRDLELGDEVTWTPEQLQRDGAFVDIIESAIEMVNKIDRVGRRGDNLQLAQIQTALTPVVPKTSMW